MRIAVVGALCRDTIRIVRSNSVYRQPGGTVFYSSRALAAWGADVAAVPVLSPEDSDLLRALEHPRISVLPLRTERTTEYELTYAGDPPEAVERRVVSRASGARLTERAAGALRACRAAHLGPLTCDEMDPAFFRRVRESVRGIVGLDAQGLVREERRRYEEWLVGNVDVLKVDEEEAKILGEEEDLGKAVEIFSRWGVRETLVTMGSRGALLAMQRESHEIPAKKVEHIVDPTGCGDIFMAGYLFGRLEGRTPPEAAHLAAGFAAEQIGRRGPPRGSGPEGVFVFPEAGAGKR